MKLTEHCQHVHVCEWHEKKIEIMLIYAEFLHTHKRHSEAGAILVAIWTEYEHHEFSMFESIVVMFNAWKGRNRPVLESTNIGAFKVHKRLSS